jgi:hypothetical protein
MYFSFPLLAASAGLNKAFRRDDGIPRRADAKYFNVGLWKRYMEVTYRGYWTGEDWEVVVKRPMQPLRMLDLPSRKGEWARSILTSHLGDEGRAADLHNDFAAVTIRRFTKDWELSESDIEKALLEVEMLRARLRIALARG